MGSSLILKMSVETAMKELGVSCEVEHTAAGTMEGMKYDLLVAAEDLREHLSDKDNVVIVSSIVKVADIKESIREYLKI